MTCEDVFDLPTLAIRQVLKDAKLEIHDIHEIVMAGGGSKMTIIQKTISNYMNGAALVSHIDPETVVVKGA